MDGKFLGPGGSSVPTSQALLSSLIEECFDITQEIRAREVSKNVSPSLMPIYDRLSEMRSELENLVLTHRWSLRCVCLVYIVFLYVNWFYSETDLWNYSLSLREIDKMRVDGKFVDAEGNRPTGQYVSLVDVYRKLYTLNVIFYIIIQVLLYLLRRCYGLIYRLLSSSEPVSEELMPIVSPLASTVTYIIIHLSLSGQ